MDLLQKTIKFCKENNIKPARSRGQNFLIKENIYNKIIKAADLKKNDVVLEVGSGPGFLTEKLAERAKKVIAIELDDKLAEQLTKKNLKNVQVVNQDILKAASEITSSVIASKAKQSLSAYRQTNEIASSSLKTPPRNDKYKIVANLPYNITSRFLRKFLSEADNKPSLMVLMLQREVAERLIAKPGQMSLLAVSAQFYAEVKILFNVSRDAFWPKPKVDSTVVELRIKNLEFRIKNKNEDKFFYLVKAGFMSKRKKLQSNLVKNSKIDKNIITKIFKELNLNENTRAQELSVDEWIELYLKLQVISKK